MLWPFLIFFSKFSVLPRYPRGPFGPAGPGAPINKYKMTIDNDVLWSYFYLISGFDFAYLDHHQVVREDLVIQGSLALQVFPVLLSVPIFHPIL